MVRHVIDKKEFVWQKKRRRAADKGKSKDRRRKIVDGIIIQDHARRQEDAPTYDDAEKRGGEDRRNGKDRRK